MPCWCQRRMGRLAGGDREATGTQITTTRVCRIPYLNTQHVENLEADVLQQQKTHTRGVLSAKNRKLQLQFTQTHQNWTIDDWKNIVWSDESGLICNVQMVESVNNMDPSCSVSANHALNSTAYLSSAADHVHPFMTTVDHLLIATSSRMMHRVTKLW